MTKIHIRMMTLVLILTLVSVSLFSQAQQATTSANAIVPPLVKFSGTLTDVNGKPLSGVVGVTFSLYKDEQGGAPLWLETQTVTLDKNSHYTVMLGSTSSSGLPADIFVAGEARWLAVQAEGQGEQARVLLLSVPYALKAGDAQTLGGLPASAFVLAAPAAGSATAMTSGSALVDSSAAAVLPAASSDVTTTGGTVNALPLFSTATNIQNSLLTQTGTAAISVAGKLNLPATGTAIATASKNSQPLTLTASAFNSGTAAAVTETFQWQAEATGNDTATPSGAMHLLFGSGTAVPAETGLSISPKGLISFAPGQAFPGTVTSVTAGTDLTASGAGDITLNLNTASTDKRYAQLNASNNFTGTQSVTGTFGVFGNSIFVGHTLATTGEFTTNLGVGVGSPQAALEVAGNKADALVGDPGCGSGYTAIGFTNGGPLSGCSNYALLGGPSGGTFLNASGTASIHFRSNNNELATIDNAGNVDVIGINGGGNLTVAGTVHSANVAASTSASNAVVASQAECTGILSAPNSNCQTPNMTLTVTTSGGPVLVMANIGAVISEYCTIANFYLVMDGKFIGKSFVNSASNIGNYSAVPLALMSLQTPPAGKHTFQVQESDDNSNSVIEGCGPIPTSVSGTAFYSETATRTLIVREF
jgi:hypothetical protein